MISMNFFYKCTQGDNKGVCMDIVDTVKTKCLFFQIIFLFKILKMNTSRLLWSKIYACRRHDPDYMAVMGISLFIPTIVLVFYVTALFKGERKQKKLSRRKKGLVHQF